MSRIFIHPGAHKTGTSFIQENLVANAAAFDKQGWRVIWLEKDFKKAKSDAVKVRGKRGAKVTKHLDSFFEEIKNDPRDVFLSHEGFLGSSSMEAGQIYPHHQAAIKVLKDNFPGRQIQIGFCIRNFADQAESSYNSRVSRGKHERSFAKYAKNISPRKVSWLKIIEHLSDAFGADNLVLWTYEDFKKDGVGAFAKIVQSAGVDTADIAAVLTKPANVSLTIPQIQLLWAWNKAVRENLDLSHRDAKMIKEKLYKLLHTLPRTASSKGLLPEKKRRNLTAKYELEVAAIRERWGHRMLNFDPPASAHQPPPQSDLPAVAG
ncbi:MAG TPA: sulfotransferase domain-containing protein [Rhizomicrobium sp.]|jgi:hypothetical protein